MYCGQQYPNKKCTIKSFHTRPCFQTNANIYNQLSIRKHSVSNMFTQATFVYYHFSNYIIHGTSFTRGPAILRGWQFFCYSFKIMGQYHNYYLLIFSNSLASLAIMNVTYHSGLNFAAVYVELLNRIQFMSFNDHLSDKFLCQEKSNMHPYV